LPLRVQTSAAEKMEDLLYRVDNALQIRQAYEHTPLVDIKQYINPGVNEEFFDSIMIIENYPLDSRLVQSNSALSVDSYSMVEETHYALTVSLMVSDDIAVDFIYNSRVVAQEALVKLAGHFKNILIDMTLNPGREISGLEVMSDEEKKKILHEFNRTAVKYPGDQLIHRLMEEQAQKKPDHIALAGTKEGVSRGTRYLTYRELNEKTNHLAHDLRERGVRPDTIVALIVERSIRMVIGILGILKSGGSYLPIDPGSPR
ncbi:MAG: AMP-binding protein, partial [bacterium]|nr:AMP-binding protein [bacterium]